MKFEEEDKLRQNFLMCPSDRHSALIQKLQELGVPGLNQNLIPKGGQNAYADKASLFNAIKNAQDGLTHLPVALALIFPQSIENQSPI